MNIQILEGAIEQMAILKADGDTETLNAIRDEAIKLSPLPASTAAVPEAPIDGFGTSTTVGSGATAKFNQAFGETAAQLEADKSQS